MRTVLKWAFWIIMVAIVGSFAIHTAFGAVTTKTIATATKYNFHVPVSNIQITAASGELYWSAWDSTASGWAKVYPTTLGPKSSWGDSVSTVPDGAVETLIISPADPKPDLIVVTPTGASTTFRLSVK